MSLGRPGSGKMSTWEGAILKIIAGSGGTAFLKHVYASLPGCVKLTDEHYEITYNAPAYHHQARAHVGDLLDKGEVSRAERGAYSITSKGRSRIGV
jgi:hypothetical protein